MQPLQFLVPLGFLEAVEPYITTVILVLVLANMVTRLLAHRQHVSQAQDGDGDEALSRSGAHTATTVLLVLSSMAYMVVHPHGGMVMTVLVVGMFLSDFFEFESRKVEARNELPIERPKSALVVSLVVLLYAAFQSLFVYVQGYWNLLV